MNENQYLQALNNIEEIAKSMDVPAQRVRDIHWLNRNVGIRNSEHPRFAELLDKLKETIKLYNENL
jgi:hypothetical protein